MSNAMDTCQECKYCLLQDSGYSNYTVMGTEFYCLNNRNHENDGDDLWGLKLNICDKFKKGDPVYLDVDGEVQYTESELCDDVWVLYSKFIED